jgi:hypothetical protein
MSTRRRRWLLAGRALAAGAALGIVGFLAFNDPLEAARRGVPLGADQAAVEAAVGRPAYCISRTVQPDDGRYVLGWTEGGDMLRVAFDANGRATAAWVDHCGKPTLWERFRAWLGW